VQVRFAETNKGLNRRLTRQIGLSAAEAWQQSTLKTPVPSFGWFFFGIGAPAGGAVPWALESMNRRQPAGRPRTRNSASPLPEVQFQQAQMQSVHDTLALANRDPRSLWVNAVAAFSRTVSYLKTPPPSPPMRPQNLAQTAWAKPVGS